MFLNNKKYAGNCKNTYKVLKLTNCDKRKHISVYFKHIQFDIAYTESVFGASSSQNQKQQL